MPIYTISFRTRENGEECLEEDRLSYKYSSDYWNMAKIVDMALMELGMWLIDHPGVFADDIRVSCEKAAEEKNEQAGVTRTRRMDR